MSERARKKFQRIKKIEVNSVLFVFTFTIQVSKQDRDYCRGQDNIYLVLRCSGGIVSLF
jgi:hypothetical protein